MKKYLKNVSIRLFIVVIAAAALAVGSLIQFDYSITNGLKENAYRVLGESAVNHISTVKARISGRFDILRGVSSYISSRGDMTAEELEQLTAAAAADFAMIGVSGANGDCHTSTGFETNIADRDYFINSMNGYEDIEQIDHAKLDEKARIILSVPIYSENGEVAGVVHGSFFPEEFNELLVSDAYMGTSNVFICDLEGCVIAMSENNTDITAEENALNFFEDAKYISGSFEALKKKLNNGGSGAFAIETEMGAVYISFMPTGIDNWFIFNMVPAENVMMTAEFINNDVMILVMELVAVFAALIVFCVLEERKRIKIIEAEKLLLSRSEERYKVVDSFSDSIIFEGDYLTGAMRYNDNFKNIFGREPIIKTIEDWKMPNKYVMENDMSVFLKLGEDIINKVPRAQGEYRISDAEGVYEWYRMEYAAESDENGMPIRFVGRMMNIEKEKKATKSLRVKAHRDPLTGLYNRSYAREHIDEFLKYDGKNGYHAFYILDIDHFKSINDNYGHMEGDRVLKSVAETVSLCFRSSDILSRIGGDEFVLFIKDLGSAARVIAKADELCCAVRTVKANAEGDEYVTCSVGIAVYRDDGTTFAQLYEKADEALYKAKAEGKDRFVKYTERAQ